MLLLGRLPLGHQSTWIQVLGASLYLSLLGLLMLALFSLWERNTRLWEALREEARFGLQADGRLPQEFL